MSAAGPAVQQRRAPSLARRARARGAAAAARVALAALAGACGGDSGGPAPADAPPLPDGAAPREVVTDSAALAVNDIVEAILVGGPGDHARLEMTAGGAVLDWNLHGHAGGGTQVVMEELKVTAVDYTFSPVAQADWYLLLRNKGQTAITVQLRIELFGGMTWTGWQ